MTREHAMLQLLKLGPLTRDELHTICGWDYHDTLRVISALEHAGLIHPLAHRTRTFVATTQEQPCHLVPATAI